MKPTISVIVPVYNTQEYLRQCIESILAQTYRDIEVILVNDGSTDESPSICEQYALKDSRIKVIHQKNQGQASARNHALELAKGEWISFVDSDDMIHPQMLELLYNAVIGGRTHMSMCMYEESVSVPALFFQDYGNDFQIFALDEELLLNLLEKGQYPAWIACNKLVHKSIVDNALFTSGYFYEDNAVVCRWIYQAHIVSVVPYKMYFYRVNPKGTTKSTFNVKKLDYLWALKQIVSFFLNVKYYKLCSEFCCLYVRNAAYFYQLVLKDLKDKKIAFRVKYELFSFVYKYRLYMDCKEVCYIIMENIYPRLYIIYEFIQHKIYR